MRAVVQRVSRAQVSVGDEVVGQIGPGLLVLLGVAKTDTRADADYLAAKIPGLRIFDDERGKMNLSLSDIAGSVLCVSQFTLYGDVRKGKRPSFDEAALAPMASQLYEYFVQKLRGAAVTPVVWGRVTTRGGFLLRGGGRARRARRCPRASGGPCRRDGSSSKSRHAAPASWTSSRTRCRRCSERAQGRTRDEYLPSLLLRV